MTDILDKLQDLHKQATEERSHYYVAACAEEAITEIKRLRRDRTALVSICRNIFSLTSGVVVEAMKTPVEGELHRKSKAKPGNAAGMDESEWP